MWWQVTEIKLKDGAGRGSQPLTKTRPADDGKDARGPLSGMATGTTRPLKTEVRILGQELEACVDTGAGISLLRKDMTRRLGIEPEFDSTVIRGLAGWSQTLGKKGLQVEWAGVIRRIQFRIVEDMPTEVLLGVDTLLAFDVTIRPRIRQVTLGSGTESPEMVQCWIADEAEGWMVKSRRTVRVPPRTAIWMEVQLTTTKGGPEGLEGLFLPRGSRRYQLGTGLSKPDSEGRSWVELRNSAEEQLRIRKGTKLGVWVPLRKKAVPREEVLTLQEEPASENKEEEAASRFRMKEVLQRKVKEANVTDEQQTQLGEVLESFLDIFKETLLPGQVKLELLRINTGDHPPVRAKPYRLSEKHWKMAEEEMQRMVDAKVVRPASGPWCAPVVIAIKKDGKPRFCVDYRQLNKITKADAYTLPRIDDMLDRVGRARYVSSLDCLWGYWQLAIYEPDREKTAFWGPKGLYEFNVMPFGLTNAPGTFQRGMEQILAETLWKTTMVYLDDVVIFSDSWEEHLEHLRQVFTKFRAANLAVKAEKCHFCLEELPYLGHIITKHGLKTDPRIIKSVKECPPPTNLHELRRFLGLANYYRRFVPDFSKVAEPLRRLTSPKVTWEWTEACQTAFETLKTKLTETPVLVFPDPSKPYLLQTDASDEGMGAVLSQRDDQGHE